MSPIRTLFIGTPSFAQPSLEALIHDSFFEIIGVITQPDRPVGRNQVNTQPPVKTLALKYGLTVFQPERIRNFVSEIEKLAPELIVLVAYGQIIPEAILAIPAFGCINVHGSLLPKYRGAAVVQAPIINGDKETGVTIMVMDTGLDTGPILSQAKFALNGTETTSDLLPKLAKLGADALIPTLHKYVTGSIKPQPQENEQASYVKILKKDDARIDWTRTASEIERFVRAMNPWPLAWTTWNGKMVKIIAVEPHSVQINQYKPGQVFLNNNRPVIQCGINSLAIKQLQLEGKTVMSAEDFLRGQSDIIHAVLT